MRAAAAPRSRQRRSRPATRSLDLIGESRSAVMGLLHRLRTAGDPRLPSDTGARDGPVATAPAAIVGLAPIDALAELAADGWSIATAARRMRRPEGEVRQIWRRICSGLGSQAV